MLLIIIFTVVLTYLGGCSVLFLFQRSLIYFPQPRGYLTGVDIMSLPIAEGQVLVTAVRHKGPEAVIYFGGNAEDVSGSTPSLTEAFPDQAIYLMHYRGYGGSSGKPSEKALLADGLALFDEVRTRHERVTVTGRSLGSGIAVYVASQRPAKELILITPYDSLAEIGAAHFPFMPVRWLLLDKYESWRYAPQVEAPTLMIVAEHDEVIPRESSDRLQTRFEEGFAKMKVLPGTNHNNISFSPEYVTTLRGR